MLGERAGVPELARRGSARPAKKGTAIGIHHVVAGLALNSWACGPGVPCRFRATLGPIANIVCTCPKLACPV